MKPNFTIFFLFILFSFKVYSQVTDPSSTTDPVLTIDPAAEPEPADLEPSQSKKEDFQDSFQSFTDGLGNVTDSLRAITNVGREKLDRITQVMDSIKSLGAYKMFIEGESVKLPFAVLPPQVSKDFAIVVDSIYLSDAGEPQLQVWMQMKMKNDKRLTFRALDVPMANLASGMSLYLVSTTNIKVGDKGYSVTFNGLDDLGRKMAEFPNEVNASCFASFDCEGFKKLVLDGSVDFDPEAISQPDTITENKKEPFSLDFFTEVQSSGDLLLAFENIPKFQFSKIPGFTVSAKAIYVDLSETTNIPGLKLPTAYTSYIEQKYTNADPDELFGETWEGVYIPNVSMTIPRRHTEGSAQKTPITISIDDIIVDQFGVSLDVTALDLLDYANKSNTKGFKFTIDRAELSLKASVLTKAKMMGLAYIPISKEKQAAAESDGEELDQSVLNYDLMMSRGANEDWSYNASMALKTKIEVEAFKRATMTLTYAELNVEYSDKKFDFNVILDGSMYIVPTKKNDANDTGSGSGMGVAFKNLQLRTQSPYIKVLTNGYVRYNAGSGGKLSNLPIKIESIALLTEGERYGLNMNISVMFAGKKEGSEESSGSAFSGSAGFTIWTKRDVGSKKFKYDGFDLNEICLDVDQESFSVKGCIKKFDKDPIYGKGFCGNVEINILDKIEVSAATIFGKVSPDDLPEGEVEDIASLNASAANHNPAEATGDDSQDSEEEYRYWFVDVGVSFSPGITLFTGVDMNGVFGGVYNNMTMQPEKPTAASGEPTVTCETVSGMYYVPMHNIFGIMLGIGIQSTGGGQAYNGRINFGVEFYKSGGLRKIATWGNLDVMADLNVPSGGALGSAAAKAVPADENTEAIPAKSKTQEDPPGGVIALNWFVEYNHTTKTLMGDFKVFVAMGKILKGGMAQNQAGQISFKASPDEWYLWVGQPTPALMNSIVVLDIATISSYFCVGNKLPDPPMALVPEGITNNAITQEDMMGLGAGFSFGMRLDLGVEKEQDFKVFKVKAKAGIQAGFDVMIAKSSVPIPCSCKECKGDRGKENWYAMGQAYFKGYASVGACGRRKCKDIVGFELSAYAQAQLPNPNYFAGTIKGSVTFIGLTKSFKKGFDFGEKCGGDTKPDELSFINGIFPATGSIDVSVYESILINFTEAESDYSFSYNDKRYDFETSISSIVDADGVSIDARMEFLKDREQANVRFDRALPENSEVTLVLVTKIQKDGTNELNDANFPSSYDTLVFTTGKEPLRIPNSNIDYSYPSLGMENFYKQEASRGYIKFVTLPNVSVQLNQDEQFHVLIFENGAVYDRTSDVKFIDDIGGDNFEFALPTARLEPNSEYVLKLVKGPKVSNASQGTTQLTPNVTVGVANGPDPDLVLVEIPFRCSMSNTFRDKMVSFTSNNTSSASDVLTAIYTSTSNELFTDQELFGSRYYPALISTGEIDYNNSEVDQLYDDVKANVSQFSSFNSISISSVAGGIDLVNGTLSTLTTFADDHNAGCLIKGGGCNAIEYSDITIPAGNIELELHYTLPGRSRPNSTFTLDQNLATAIKL